jgi:ubiquinone/menaquinone biosynthesis C-methylase UbiE
MRLITQWIAGRCGGMPALYERFTAPLEAAGLSQIRARMAGDLTGRVLEVGCGTGLNFAHYPAAAEVTAVEPFEEYRAVAAARAKMASARITVQEGDAQALPFPDASFDAALATMVFCSVPDEQKGLRELCRVLRPDAPARLLEHVRSPRVLGAAVQGIFNPLWRWLVDGCNLNRDTVAMVAAAGFQIEEVRMRELRTLPPRFPWREIRARTTCSPISTPSPAL